MGPPKKQHITAQNVIASIRNDCAINADSIDLNVVDHTLNTLSLHHPNNSKKSRKRRFEDMDHDEIECKDKMDKIGDLQTAIKRMKVWDPTNNSTFAHPVDVTMNTNSMTMDTENENHDSLELIPSNLHYAQFINEKNEHPLISKICRNEMLHGTTLNGHNGALILYKKPQKSWKEFVEKETVNDTKIKNKRPIRLHPSYSGLSRNAYSNFDTFKKIANQYYVSTMKRCKEDDKHKNDADDYMDCD